MRSCVEGDDKPAAPRGPTGRRLAATGSAVLVLSLVLQLGNFVRTLLLTAEYGASRSLDAFYLANNLTVTVFGIAGAAITTVLVPELVGGANAALVRRFTRWIRIVSIPLVIGVIALVTLGAPIVAGGFPRRYQIALAIMTVILLVGQNFRVGTSVLAAELQTDGKFTLARIANLAPSLLPVIWFAIYPSLVGICVAIGVSYALEYALSYVFSRRGKVEPECHLVPDQTAEVGRLKSATWPVLISSGLFQSQMLLFTAIAGWLGAGVTTLFSNSMQVIGLLQAVVVQNFVILAYPRIAAWVKQDAAAAAGRVPRVLWVSLAPVLVLGWSFYQFGLPALEAVFLRGQYTTDNVRTLYDFSLVLMVTVPLGLTRDLLYRVLYSNGLMAATARNSIAVVIVNVAITAVLVRPFGVYAIFVAMIIGNLVSLAGIAVIFRRRLIQMQWSVIVFALGYGAVVLIGASLIAGGRADIGASFDAIASWRVVLASLALAVAIGAGARWGWRSLGAISQRQSRSE